MNQVSSQNLRIVNADALSGYLRKNNLAPEDGDATFSESHVLYHTALPGFVELDGDGARMIEVFREEGSVPPQNASLLEGLCELGWDRSERPTVDELVAKTQNEFLALQNAYELRTFLGLVEKQQPKVVVEIGTAAGGTFFSFAQLAAPDATLVSIDYPGGPYGGGQDSQAIELYSTFCGPKQSCHFIRDRSFHHSTKTDLLKILDGRTIDLLFIDGDHSLGGVLADHQLYAELVTPGGMMAFHDIVLEPEVWGRGADSGLAWKMIREQHSNWMEIFDPEGSRTPPPKGPLDFETMASRAWGIGVVFVEADQ